MNTVSKKSKAVLYAFNP